MTFNIYVPSYKRSNKILTHNLVEYCTYVVRKSEEDLYKAKGVNVLAVEDNLIVGIPAVQNWLIENVPEDVFCILDDDIHKFIYRTETTKSLGEKDKELITSEIERLAQIVYDLELGHLAGTAKADPKSYQREFSFMGLPSSMKIINRANVKSRFNEIDFLNDIDFQLQEILYNRIVLISEYFADVHDVDTNAGGSNSSKTLSKFMLANEEMKNKWGKYYIPASDEKKVGKVNVTR